MENKPKFTRFTQQDFNIFFDIRPVCNSTQKESEH